CGRAGAIDDRAAGELGAAAAEEVGDRLIVAVEVEGGTAVHIEKLAGHTRARVARCGRGGVDGEDRVGADTSAQAGEATVERRIAGVSLRCSEDERATIALRQATAIDKDRRVYCQRRSGASDVEDQLA